MATNLLCTISEDPNMFNGLRFLGNFFENKDKFRLTLLCMAAPDSQYCRWRAGNGNGETPPADVDRNWKKAREEALRMLQGDGFTPENIDTKSSSSMICNIGDVEDEMGSESYDAVVMGRRGLNRLKDFIDKSLSHKLFNKRPEIPMWLCRKPDLNRKDVLLCVDGSESAFETARFLARMLAGETHKVTLCHITKIKTEDHSESYAIFERCEEIMAQEGFDTSLLRHMIYPSDNCRQAILDNANWGKFAIVAAGTTNNPRKRLLYGSITSFLFTELSGSVLLVHP